MFTKKRRLWRVLLVVVIVLNSTTFTTGSKEEQMDKKDIVFTDEFIASQKAKGRNDAMDAYASGMKWSGVDFANKPDFSAPLLPIKTKLDMIEARREQLLRVNVTSLLTPTTTSETLRQLAETPVETEEEFVLKRLAADIEASRQISTTTAAITQPVREFVFIPNEERVCEMIDRICAEQGFNDPALIKAMVFCESGFKKDVISSAGCEGLMQITPGYFIEQMERYGVLDLCADEEGNLRIGIEWIAYLIEKYDGDYHKALVAYNLGESRVDIKGIYSNSYSRKVVKIASDYM